MNTAKRLLNFPGFSLWILLAAAVGRAGPILPDGAGNTPLHVAAYEHDVAAVESLLRAGADVNARNAAGVTPLIYGAGDARIVALLLAHKADANALSAAKNSALAVAVAAPEPLAATRLLLDAGADVHVKDRFDAEFILSPALMRGDLATVTLLLDRGASVAGSTFAPPLSTAAWLGDRAAVELLLARGADVNQFTLFAGSALNWALYGHQRETAALLLAKGADPKRPSTWGHGTPPLLFAAYHHDGDAAIARQLLAKGADVNQADEQGETALSYALKSGPDTPLVAYLREAGAKPARAERTRTVPARPVPAGGPEFAALVRARVQPALDLLQRSSTTFITNAHVRDQARCVSCHQQYLPAVAFDLGRRRGLRVDEAELGRQLAGQVAMWTPAADRARQMLEPVPDAPVSLGTGLFGMQALRHAPDATTGALVDYLLRAQRPSGDWASYDYRPPMEDGPVVAAAWAVYAISAYTPAGREQVAAGSLRRAGEWFAGRSPATHNEAVMRLLGLQWTGRPARERAEAAAAIRATQRADGGWAQLPGRETDAWATGSALYALHVGAGLATDDPVYRRGAAFLLRTQFDDGSWWVRSRSWPFQPHFDGRFPHGKDQWISAGGTAWAAMALLLTLEPAAPAPAWPTAADLVAKFNALPPLRKTAPAGGTADGAPANLTYARDIRPILERSCLGCHDGQRPKGDFNLAARESLLKGGQSGEPAVAPGYASDSPLLRYVRGEVEDLEMPPLHRREKYPELTPAEIERLAAWIDAGAR